MSAKESRPEPQIGRLMGWLSPLNRFEMSLERPGNYGQIGLFDLSGGLDSLSGALFVELLRSLDRLE